MITIRAIFDNNFKHAVGFQHIAVVTKSFSYHIRYLRRTGNTIDHSTANFSCSFSQVDFFSNLLSSHINLLQLVLNAHDYTVPKLLDESIQNEIVCLTNTKHLGYPIPQVILVNSFIISYHSWSPFKTVYINIKWKSSHIIAPALRSFLIDSYDNYLFFIQANCALSNCVDNLHRHERKISLLIGGPKCPNRQTRPSIVLTTQLDHVFV